MNSLVVVATLPSRLAKSGETFDILNTCFSGINSEIVPKHTKWQRNVTSLSGDLADRFYAPHTQQPVTRGGSNAEIHILTL